MAKTKLTQEELNFVKKWKDKKGSLIMILHLIQNHHGYVPKSICIKLSKELKIPLARIYEVLTFYNYFSLTPPAKNKIAVCMGTACYLKGAPKLVDVIKKELNINHGEVTKDGLFKLEEVRCLGCCGLAPVVTVNDKVYGKLGSDEMLKIIEDIKNKEENCAKAN